MLNDQFTLERLAEFANPTGGRQTPTPWRKHDRTRGIYRYALRDANGVTVTRFVTREDRDFALFWINTHAGIIAILRQSMDSYEFLSHGAGGDMPLRDFAGRQREAAEAWHEFFRTLGASAKNGGGA